MNLNGIFHKQRDLTTNSGMEDNTRDMSNMPDTSNGQLYYYVGAIYQGQPVVLGRFYSWSQAEQEGKKKLQVPFEIYPLATGDMRKATKIVKYKLLEKDNMDVVMHRAKHIIEPEDEYGSGNDGENS